MTNTIDLTTITTLTTAALAAGVALLWLEHVVRSRLVKARAQ
ncbi:hypothetical protein [Leucobacter salsicius]|nr:hypothetical protein [Leucobacter salsicius]